jgi:hypothetical protein
MGSKDIKVLQVVTTHSIEVVKKAICLVTVIIKEVNSKISHKNITIITMIGAMSNMKEITKRKKTNLWLS